MAMAMACKKVPSAHMRTCASRMVFARAYSGFDEPGRMLREEERSREAIFIRQREAQLLERLRKQTQKVDQIKEAITDYKKEQASLQDWLEEETKTKEPDK